MITITINGFEFPAFEGETILDVAKRFGIFIPTLCLLEGHDSFGVCRLCIVEIGNGDWRRVVTSCNYPVKEGLAVHTDTKRIIQHRKILIELALSRCPDSKTLQDLASLYGVEQMRFTPKHEDCLLCGLCIRMCNEQMMSGAIGFIGRGKHLRISTPFDRQSEVCRNCGACMYICPMVEVQCRGPKEPGELCNACLQMTPTCVEVYDRQMCYMSEDCGTCIRPGSPGHSPQKAVNAAKRKNTSVKTKTTRARKNT